MRYRSRLFGVVIAAAALLGSGCTPLHRTGLPYGSFQENTAQLSIANGTEGVFPGTGLTVAATGMHEVPTAALPRWAQIPPLSPGDRLQVDIEDGEAFSGRFEVDMDGTIKLPYLSPLHIAGDDVKHAEWMIRNALVSGEVFKPHRVRVSVRIHEWSHVQVHVTGAVFNPGLVTINVREPEERALKDDLASGDYPSERMLAAALRAAGGVRPDAAVGNIRLIRGGRTLRVSYAGLIQGHPVQQVPLMSGDSIVVPRSGRFDPDLVSPSAITPPGIRVFLSNLTVPATGNAVSAVSRAASSLPYGSRLLTGAVSANCVGGVNSTSASRYAVLVRTNPLTGREEAVERSIHHLLRSPDDHDVNPQLMPDDSVSCYDSGVTNLRDIGRSLFEVLLPLSLL